MNPNRVRLVPLAVALLAVTLATNANAETLTDVFRKTVTVSPGVEISLVNTNGNVEVLTWDRDSVEIVAEKKVRSRGSTSAREALDAIEIRLDESSGGLDIETHLPSSSTGMMSWLFGRHVDASVSYELRVPASAHLDVRTVNGSVSSDGPEGEQTLRSTNGRITVEDAGGSVRASTTNGSIKVEVVEAASDADIEASTTNGSITLHIPADLRGRIQARTVNGSVRTEIPVTLDGSASKRRLNADLNGGGAARIGLRTTNGSIRILES